MLTRPSAISLIASGSRACSVAWIASSSVCASRSGGTGTGRWTMIGPESTPSSTKCTVTPVILTPYSSAWPTASRPGKQGSSARVHVDDPAAEAGDEGGREKLHVAGQNHQVGPPLLDPVRHCPVAGFAVVVVLTREDRGLDPGVAGPPQSHRIRPVGGHPRDLYSLAAVELIDDRLQVGAGARGEHAELEVGHAATLTGGRKRGLIAFIERPSRDQGSVAIRDQLMASNDRAGPKSGAVILSCSAAPLG
jgi:hypothetical protein